MNGFLSEEMKRFNHLNGEIEAVYHEISLRLGLSDSASKILYTICNEGDSCLLNDICKLSGLSKQTINSALRKLEADGILYLKQADGRKKRVCLTEQGKCLAEKTAMRIIEAENEIFAGWTAEERKTYLALTQKYLVGIKEKVSSF